MVHDLPEADDHRPRGSFQCGEEEGWDLLLNAHILLPYEALGVWRVDRDQDRSKEHRIRGR